MRLELLEAMFLELMEVGGQREKSEGTGRFERVSSPRFRS